MKNKKIALMYLLALSLAVFATGAAFAGFLDKGVVQGSSFSVGTSDLRFLENLSLGEISENLKDTLTGPAFSNIAPNWLSKYYIKLYNSGTTNLAVTTSSEYTTANDPDDLRSYIYVEPFEWNDTNNNGIEDPGEIGTSFGKKTIIKWKTEGFNLGTFNVGQTKGYLLQFTTETLSDTKQGKTGIYDFEFDGISQ